jgi:hypothetical protein
MKNSPPMKLQIVGCHLRAEGWHGRRQHHRAGVWERQKLRAMGDGLFRHWVLLGLADCGGDLILVESQGVLQEHLDGRAYVEKEVVRVEEQCDRGYATDGSSDCGADDGVFCAASGKGCA